SKEDEADLFLRVIDDNKVSLIKDNFDDVINLNCKFFNFDNKYYKDGVKVERRDNVTVILRNSNNEIMCLDWKNEKNWRSFVSGGIENNDLIQSAIDEIREETGYVNVRFVREVNCETRDKFYAPHKGVNRYLINRTVVFDLLDDERFDLEEHEAKKHTPVWVKEEEILDFLNIEANKFVFKEYLGDKQNYDSLGVLVRDILN
ncbi:MAG: hypothetical protein OQK82_00065, partial [Candidatus Pacearchaeota archaeon]|nr:hypothetical protein [Candidatus Pacearchaeota archaeon]